MTYLSMTVLQIAYSAYVPKIMKTGWQ